MVARLLRRGVIASAGAAADLAVGSFAVNTSTGTQAVTGVGFTPKALVFFKSGSASTSGTWDSHIHQAVGFTSGPTESYSLSGASQDAVGTSNTGRRIAAKALTFIDYDGATIIGEADLSSFDADGFTLDWTDAPTTADEVGFVAVGGTNVQAKAVNWTSPTSTGNHAVTGVGFTPDVVLHVAGHDGAAGIPSSSGGHRFAWGAMDDSGNQWTHAVFAQDGQSTSNTGRYQRTDKCISEITGNGTIEEEAEFVSMDADGFTTNFTTAFNGAFAYISLCLSGISATVGNFAKTTNAAPASQSITGVGFKPGAVLLSSFANVATTSVQPHAAWGTGAGDGTNERSTLQVDVDGLSTTDAESLWKNDKIIALQDSATGSIDAEADLTSRDPNGFTLNWTTNDADADEVLFLCLG